MINFLDVSFSDEDGSCVFYGLNVSIGRGERVVLKAAASSCRKDFISLVGGFGKPDTGVISIFGASIARLDEEELSVLRGRIGFILEDNVLISNLKVIENVALPLMFHGSLPYDECLRRAADLLTEAGYKSDLWLQPAMLGVSEKKLVSCARAVVTEPDLVICGNLFEGLMPGECERIAEFLASYQATHKDCAIIFLMDADDDLPYVKPTRVLKIEGNKIIEAA